MRFPGLTGLLVIANFVAFSGLAIGQQTVTVPIEVVNYPDLIVYNAKVVTMDDHSVGLNTPVGTIAEALAVRDGKIMAVGTSATIRRMAGPLTDEIDARGRMLMPSIINTHDHAHNSIIDDWVNQHQKELMQYYSSYEVTGRTFSELTEAIIVAVKNHVESTQPGNLAIVNLRNPAPTSAVPQPTVAAVYLSEGNFPKQKLDPLAPNHPVFLRAHPSSIGNEALVEAIGSFYGPVSKDAMGMDDIGRIRETHAQYPRMLPGDRYFQVRVPQMADILEEGLLEYAARGMTTYVSHIMGERFIDAFNLLVKDDRMPIRLAYTHWAGFAMGYADSANFYRRMGDLSGHGIGDDYFFQVGVGLGAIDSAMPRICSSMEAPMQHKELEFCQNGPGTRQYESTKTAIANYQRVSVGHAQGDKGVDYFMDAVEDAMRENPTLTLDYIRSRRLTSDHCDFYPRIDALPRMAKLGMMISCDAATLTGSMDWIGVGMYPPIYIKQIAPIRSTIEAGVPVTTESSGFAANVPFLTRVNRDGVAVSPEETVDRNTLLKMMTIWAARFALKEDVLGSLEPGKWADFMVLNKDYFEGPPEAIAEIYPLMTVVGGKILVIRENFARELGRNPIGPQIDFSSEQ
jgi:predicted amidohydrolase YtcJ